MFKVNESVGYQLGMISRKTGGRFIQLMKENNIKFGFGGWIVLSRLWEEDGLNQQEISDRSNVAKPNISNYIDKLEKEDYIVRVVDENDRRNYKIYLTSKGKKDKELCQKLAVQSSEETLSVLTEEEKKTFITLLKKMHKG
ncbi:MAG: MarR family transcriptional regulator [Fulvivirga sp.]|nr:MarR family transcriptional regulator [Fulvivirga sp.]